LKDQMTISSIGTAVGRDYPTIAAWLAAIPADLVTADDTWIGELYNDSEFTVTTSIDIKNTITDATHYVELRAATGESWSANSALKYDSTQGACIRRVSGNFEVIEISQDYTKITGIQIKQDGTSGGGIVGKANNCTVERCLIENQATSGAYCIDGQGNGPWEILNNAFITRVDALINFQQSGDIIENNTFVRTGTKGGSGITNPFAGSGALNLKNNAFFNFNAVASNLNGCTGSNNATDLANVGFGVGNQENLVPTDEVFSIIEGSEDLRSKGNNLVGSGVNLAAITIDFRGTSRPNPPAIGCWEADRTMIAETGAFTYTGSDANFFTNTLKAKTGVFSLVGNDAYIGLTNVILESGNYTLTGNDATLLNPSDNSLNRQADTRKNWARIPKRRATLTKRIKRTLR